MSHQQRPDRLRTPREALGIAHRLCAHAVHLFRLHQMSMHQMCEVESLLPAPLSHPLLSRPRYGVNGLATRSMCAGPE